ncbi:MAG: YtxH domain-containing protein, partial [Atopostipes suicloacalis]|nr:YtxH domain-containing protein [Atopostipes suicloacalis]
KNKNGIVYLLIALISAGIALLFAPNSGKNTRKKLKLQAKDMKKSIDTSKENLVKDFKSSYFEAVDEVDKEYELLSARQKELNKTISSIEDELIH